MKHTACKLEFQPRISHLSLIEILPRPPHQWRTIAKNDWVANVDEAQANMARLADCWNAMDGIDDPNAARAVLDDPRTLAATDVYSALLAVLAEVPVGLLSDKTRDLAYAALRKAEGKS